MAMIKCPECGKEISDKADKCPNCGCPIKQDNVFQPAQVNEQTNNNNKNGNKKEKKKNSSLSTAAAVLALFTCTCPIAFIIAIIDLTTGKKENKHTGSWFAIIFFIIFACVVVSSMGNSGNDNKTEATTQAETQQENTLEATTEEVDDNIIDTDIGDCHIKYLKHEIVENMAGDKCVAIYYEFTNNSEESKAFDYVVGEKAFQNGVQLDTSTFHVNDESKARGSEIKQGITITVCSGYVLKDETADIEVEMGEWISFDDKPIDTMVLKLKSE